MTFQMTFQTRYPSRQQQTGAALIISLILLMVLTVLAVSTMRTASLGLLMAGNAQYRETAYQLAQSGIDAVMRRGDPGVLPDCTVPAADPVVAVPELNGRYATTMCYRGETFITPGYSATLPTLNFEVASTGTTDQRDARVRLVQGYTIIGVSGP